MKDDFRHHLPTGMQGFAMNTRRPVFADPRVRQAHRLGRSISSGPTRTCSMAPTPGPTSYFENSDLASSGMPQGDELKLLEQYRDELAAGAVHQAVHTCR